MILVVSKECCYLNKKTNNKELLMKKLLLVVLLTSLLIGLTAQDLDNYVIVGPDAAYPTTTWANNQAFINFAQLHTYSQTVYYESELNKFGTITHLEYDFRSHGDINVPQKIELYVVIKATSFTVFYDSSSSWLPIDEFTKIFDGEITIDFTGDGKILFELNPPINYTGGNIVIGQERSTPNIQYNTGNQWFRNQRQANRTIHSFSATAAGSFANPGTLSRVGHVPVTKFIFAPEADPVFNPPLNLRDVFVSLQAVELAWDAPEAGGDGTLAGYRINRIVGDDIVEYFEEMNPALLTFTDDLSAVQTMEDFKYNVQAIYTDPAGYSVPSNTVEPNFYSVLPVTVTGFTATIITDGISLNWITESEMNMLGYRILRAESNDFDTARYITLNDIISRNQTTTQNYNFIDRDVINGQTYVYWLEAIEINGTKEIYGPVSVIMPALPEIPVDIEQTFIVNVYPNPLVENTTANFEISVKNDETAQLRIFNIRGQLVKEFSEIPTGHHNINWDGRDNRNREVSSGIYFYQLTSPSSFNVNRIVIVK